MNMGTALIAVFVVVYLMMMELIASILVVFLVAAVVIDLMGTMHFWDETWNSVTVINSVMCIGLAVDYSAHITHAFLVAKGTYRLKHALGELGASVCHGAISTFLAIIPMAGAVSYLFKIFFKMWFGIIIFGIGHGMLLLPCILSFFDNYPSTT
mmetsp:Transcript_27432/g.12778  ORF Transcript_27432/g.12778 Transcript_27432/m.12778 type:complete len:154 (+) Transcript_27432:185-646(+)